MDSGFASAMETAVDSLASGFSSFTGSTIQESIWNGDAADNAKNQVTEKINTKVEAVKAKLENLISAIAQAEIAKTAKENIEIAKKAIGKLDSNASDYAKAKGQLESDIKKFQKEYDDAVAKIKSLCG